MVLADGLRTTKTVNGITTEYYWVDGILYGQRTGSEYMLFLYDESGNKYGFILKNGTREEYYYYTFNLQGDVIGIVDNIGNIVVEYTYAFLSADKGAYMVLRVDDNQAAAAALAGAGIKTADQDQLF